MQEKKAQSFLVMWDLPQHAARTKFYNRLKELLCDQGGSEHCQATKSAYIVEGESAQALAYKIGALATAFGAGKIGVQNGVVVLPLGEIEPRAHFAAIKQATDQVRDLTVDRRTKSGKETPRGIATGVAMPADDDKIIRLQDLFDADKRGKQAR